MSESVGDPLALGSRQVAWRDNPGTIGNMPNERTPDDIIADALRARASTRVLRAAGITPVPPDEPTGALGPMLDPDEIARRVEAVQANWTDAERERRRAAVDRVPVSTQVISVTGLTVDERD